MITIGVPLNRFARETAFLRMAWCPRWTPSKIPIAATGWGNGRGRDGIRRRMVTVVGRVVRGAGRGRKIGFPTANLKIEAGLLPPIGVYAVEGRLKGGRYLGMANIGFRPTFRTTNYELRTTNTPLLEIHLFGVTRSLYRQQMEVAFLKRLRSERRFPSPKALTRQLALDARRAQSYFRDGQVNPVQSRDEVV